MDLKRIEYLGIDRVLQRGTGHIIEENEELLLVYDDVSGAFFLVCDDEEKTIETLVRYEDSKIRLLMLPDIGIARKVFDRFGYRERLECYQVAYCGEMPQTGADIVTREAEEGDLPFLTDTYKLISPEEMKKVVERRSLIIAYHDEEAIGFIGEHLEGSMGLLYILPKHRRKGYGEALEKAFIARTMKKGFVPFGQVEKDNTASLKLQEKLGMKRSEDLICWMWK